MVSLNHRSISSMDYGLPLLFDVTMSRCHDPNSTIETAPSDTNLKSNPGHLTQNRVRYPSSYCFSLNHCYVFSQISQIIQESIRRHLIWFDKQLTESQDYFSAGGVELTEMTHGFMLHKAMLMQQVQTATLLINR